MLRGDGAPNWAVAFSSDSQRIAWGIIPRYTAHNDRGPLGFQLRLASIERGSSDGYQHRAYTFTPDGQTIISAGDSGVLSAYDLKGQRLGNYVGHESDIWAATPSPDGRLLVSGSGVTVSTMSGR